MEKKIILSEPMKPKNAKSAFQKHLRGGALQLNNMTPAQGIDAMLSFYQDDRADGCSFDEDADMLLFQWGTYDWGDGAFFDLNITRQLIFGGFEDKNIWQLSLIFKFNPTDAMRTLDSGYKWCGSLGDTHQLSKFIHDSNAFQLVAHETPDKVELEFECAG